MRPSVSRRAKAKSQVPRGRTSRAGEGKVPNIASTHVTGRASGTVGMLADYVPALHFTDCEDGVANGAGPWRCTAGVTLASTRTWATTRKPREHVMTPPLAPTKTR